MNEELVRSLVRETIARLATAPPDPHAPLDYTRGALSTVERTPLQPASFYRHASHYRYALPESGGPCAIEPGVRCTHCGYCESHGH